MRFLPAVSVPDTAVELIRLLAELENLSADKTPPPVMMSFVAAEVSSAESESEKESDDVISDLPDTMFNCAVVAVTPSILFNSAVVAVSPSRIPSSVSDTLTEPIPISPVKVGLAMGARSSIAVSFDWIACLIVWLSAIVEPVNVPR